MRGTFLTSGTTARTVGLLAVGVAAVSLAAPLMASLAVPALAIAFWRNAFATAVVVPVAAVARRAEVRALPARTLGLLALAGALLAAHFGLWISSLALTSVSSSTAIVSLQVLWVLGYDALRGAPVPPRAVLGVLLATLGAVVVSGVDLSISGRALAGDGLALLGSLAIAGYAVLGGRLRQHVSTTVYTGGCYGVAAVLLLVAARVAGQDLRGYPAEAWLLLLLLTATAQLLGHSVFNHLLRELSPVVVSLALLLEIPGATLIAAAWLGQVPGPLALVGLVLVLVGMALVLRSAPDSAEVVPG